MNIFNPVAIANSTLHLIIFLLAYMSNFPKKAPKPKADIDFEKELWDAANELRGAVAENQYKDYVLSLLFVRALLEKRIRENLASIGFEIS